MEATNQMHRLRLERNLTRRVVADHAGITERQLARYELDGHTPKLTTAVKMAELYGCTIDELVGASA
jgi:transcriptional regulator with XRE-family HTH domain